MKTKPTSIPQGPFAIETLDGARFIGRNADEIIDGMRSHAYGGEAGESREEYRGALAERARLWIKQAVRHDNSEILILDLAEIGLIAIRAL